MMDYSKWMTNLPAAKRFLPFRELVIPGSHNAGTYTMKSAQSMWGQCQNNTVYDQLQAGSRFLDIRARKNPQGDWTIKHGILDANVWLDVTMVDLARFARENPKELIVLSLSLEGSTSADYQRVIDNLGHCTFAPSLTPSMGLDDIIAVGGNIVFWSGNDNSFITNKSVYADVLGKHRTLE